MALPESSPPPSAPEPFTLHVSEDRLTDLHERLRRTRLAPDHHNDDWFYGVPSAVLGEWVEAWLAFDWRAVESQINRYDNYLVEIDGIQIHYLREPGEGPAPTPLLLVHGWPWTFWDWRDTIDALANPSAHGGDASDAFDVVVVSLPGFGLSGPLPRTRVTYPQAADIYRTLMVEVLGYDRFAASGGDQGTLTASQLGHKYAEDMIGIHLFGTVPLGLFSGSNPLPLQPNLGFTPPPIPSEDPVLARAPQPRRMPSAHVWMHGLEPQTLAAAMHDSPAGMMAWLLHRRHWWSQDRGDISDAFDRDFLLANFTLYWMTDTFASSVRSYRDMIFTNQWTPSHDRKPVVEAPTGITWFDDDDSSGQSRFWAPEYYNLVRWSGQATGGHFAAWEQPATVVDELRQTFRLLR